jgi:hypothetical protein
MQGQRPWLMFVETICILQTPGFGNFFSIDEYIVAATK